MSKLTKGLTVIIFVCGVSLLACGCGSQEQTEPQVPTKYVKEADEAVDQYNENVEKINETGNSVESETE